MPLDTKTYTSYVQNGFDSENAYQNQGYGRGKYADSCGDTRLRVALERPLDKFVCLAAPFLQFLAQSLIHVREDGCEGLRFMLGVPLKEGRKLRLLGMLVAKCYFSDRGRQTGNDHTQVSHLVFRDQSGHLLHEQNVRIVESDDPLRAALDGNEQQEPSWTKKPKEWMSGNVTSRSVRHDLAKQG